MESCDLLITNASELVTVAGPVPRVGAALDRLDVLERGAVAVTGGRIAAVGAAAELEGRFEPALLLDALGGAVLPGFVDPHTHPVFDATREREFDLRVRGRSYLEITAAGGGIFSSVRSLRTAPTERLRQRLADRFDGFVRHGTTTIEAKSGYGLDRDHELRSLELLRDVAATHPLEVLPTFLGAHQVPVEYRERRDAYIDLLVADVMPRVKESGLARACDVFCDEGAYTVDEARRVLLAAKEQGFALRVHADELASLGAAELAAEVGAESADHLCKVSAAGRQALAASGTVAVLLPCTVLSLGARALPPARELIEGGATVALATDFNPGTSFTQSMPLVIALACTLLKMSPAEAVAAATINAAHSLGIADRVGSIEVGKQADLLVLDRPSHLFLAYELGENSVSAVVKAGRIVYRQAEASVGGGDT